MLMCLSYTSMYIQWTPEQHEFELHESTYTQAFVTKYMLQGCMTHGWLNPQLRNLR